MLTLQELKQVVGNREERRKVPSARYLRENDLVSEEKPHYIEMLPIGEYTLREETAPDGYLVAEDVKFTVKDTGEIQKVVMKDEAKPEETPTETPTETPETTPTPETKTTKETKKSTSPKTGDNTPILFWILLAGAGMAGLGGTVILRKKKK